MTTLRNIASAIAISGTLLAVGYGWSASAADQGPDTAPASGDQSAPNNGSPLSGDQLNREYQNLSPATRAALANQLKSKGVDGLSSMSESDARTAFAGLPPDVKAQIQAKWDALSDEQRIALKKMGPGAVKSLVGSQMKDMMKQSVSPIVKPIQQMLQKAQSALQMVNQMKDFVKQSVSPMVKPIQQMVEKAQSTLQVAKTFFQKGRDYVQSLIAKLRGRSSQPEAQAQAQ